MQKIILLAACLLLIAAGNVQAQTYSIVIKGGHIIDPKNQIDELMDSQSKMAGWYRLQKILMPVRPDR